MASHSRRFAESGQDSTGLRSNSEGVRGTTEKSAQRFGLRKAPNESSLTCFSQDRPPALERLTAMSEYDNGQIHALRTRAPFLHCSLLRGGDFLDPDNCGEDEIHQDCV